MVAWEGIVTLTLMEGEDVASWKRDMGNWIDTIQPNQNVPIVWEQFLYEFEQQYLDSQGPNRARAQLETL